MIPLGMLGAATPRAGGGPAPVYATWDPSGLPAGCTLSNADLTVTAASFGDRVVLANKPMPALGYFECTYAPNGNGVGVGLATSSVNRINYLGVDSQGYGLYFPNNDIYRSGGVVFNGANDSTTPLTNGFAFRSSSRRLWIRKRDGSGWEGGGDPVADTSPTVTLAAGTYYPACTPYTGASAITINTGQSAFALWTPSGGFGGIA